MKTNRSVASVKPDVGRDPAGRLDPAGATDTATLTDRVPTLESVVLYPTFGHPSADSRSWHVGVSGFVCQAGRNNLRRRMFVRVLQRLLRVPAEQLTSNELFQRRVDGFLVSTEKGRRIQVELDGQTFHLERPTKRNGHFRGSFRLTREQVERLAAPLGTGPARVSFLAAAESAVKSILPQEEQRLNERRLGTAQLIGSTGVSVISDIDDTIKCSEVADRRRLLQNTFLHEFQPVAGMAEFYQRLAAEGAAFHYVSSSPWQLFEPLHEFMQSHAFPHGSFHLRAIRLRDPSVLRLFIARRATKRRVIRSIVRMFPHRQFVLIGDSGEKDPEIYGAIARQFPSRIQRILVRRVAGRAASPERLERAFRDVSPEVWQLFDHPEQLADDPMRVA